MHVKANLFEPESFWEKWASHHCQRFVRFVVHFRTNNQRDADILEAFLQVQFEITENLVNQNIFLFGLTWILVVPMISHSILTQTLMWYIFLYLSISLRNTLKKRDERQMVAKLESIWQKWRSPRERCDKEGLDQIEFLLGIHFKICHRFCIHHSEDVYMKMSQS